MNSSLTRRFVLKLAALCSGALATATGSRGGFFRQAVAQPPANAPADSTNPQTVVDWNQTHDRVWLGEQVWANPMENWRVVNGAAECLHRGGNRNVHLLTHQLTNPEEPFEMSVVIEQIQTTDTDAGAGFKFGVRADIDEYRANCFASNGIPAGVAGKELRLGNKKVPIDVDWDAPVRLVLSGKPAGSKVQVQLSAADSAGKVLGRVDAPFDAATVLGNVCIVNNFDQRWKKRTGGRYRFNRWAVSGKAFTHDPQRQFGPILWSMYSLSDSRSDEGFVLKLNALTGPLGEQDNHDVELTIKTEAGWRSLGRAELDRDAWTASFRIANWNASEATPFKLLYRMKGKDNSETLHTRTGTIRANPVDRPLRIGALTCQNDYAFPYEPVANNLLRLDPDMLYFSGDQLYEEHGGFGVVRQPVEPAILNYLRKFYQHGWAFGEAMRDRPTLCLPDDHDVFQGNIWGEGGKPMKYTDRGTSSWGGYRQTARMVNVVHKTNTGHHPDPYNPAAVEQGISVYYGDMVYGGVSFAIIADRQFKSSPQEVDTGGGRPDHVETDDFDTAKLDLPGLILLGQRQEDFLSHWTGDWRGHTMKVVLSQTVLAGVATHHGKYDRFLKADLDCGGWPQTARDRAIEIMRQGKALHINGDQHLPTLVQYGVEKQRDGGWSYCTPAIAAGYPRWWRPDDVGMPHQNRPSHGLPHTGEYVDGLGNLVYVHAVGYPEVASKSNRYARAHQKGSGFGMVTIDPQAETYLLEAFKFNVDATDGRADNQFPGWPLTVKKQENG